ncbi:MAG: 2Fe-2S iron-sulfur cluster binding domain-containing protein [Myxococcales bacterium]|nr:2Fe-2S iron-sulfur cluster binding domain-containing protein [Myxococcales bacterium]
MAANCVDVLFRPSGRRLALEPGTNLLEAAREAGLPVAQACGGEALCARCGMQILSGAENLDPETTQEATAKQRNRVARELRLSCQTRVHGPVEVTASYW